MLKHRGPYDSILAFSHKGQPEVPLQVPGGTLEDGESPLEGVKREVFEESGLTDLYGIEELGEAFLSDAEGKEEFVAHFFLCRSRETRESWEHRVIGGGEDNGMVFQYRWLPPQRALLVYDHHFHVFMRPEYLPSLFTEDSLLGLSNNTISLMPSTPLWQHEFKKAHEELLEALTDAEIEHIGSTSVPNLPAKPIIDIAISVPSPADHIDSVEDCGYQYRGEEGIKGRFYFVKGPPDHRTHHIHMFDKGSTLYKEHVVFRDTLREEPSIAREYGKLKLSLWRKLSGDRKVYTASKSKFIEGIMDNSIRKNL